MNAYVPLSTLDNQQLAQIEALLIQGEKINRIEFGMQNSLSEVSRVKSGKHTRVVQMTNDTSIYFVTGDSGQPMAV